MPFPTLSEFAAKSVAQGIVNETISLDFRLDTKCSNAIVREIFNEDKVCGENYRKLEEYKNQLSVTKIDFRKYDVDTEAVLNLANFNLVSLDFGEMWFLEMDFPDPEYGEEFLDIVTMFDRSMNNYSRRSLIHLGMASDQGYIKGWEKEVEDLFHIDISCHTFDDDRFQFPSFCASFSNLRVLDISYVKGLSSLHGINKLENLQNLLLCHEDLDNINEYKELFELKTLKHLDVSSNHFSDNWSETGTNPIRDMLAAGVRMEALEFLDCSTTAVTEHELEEFVKNHSSLQTIAAICTPCNQSTISGMKMLNMFSMSESLGYLLRTDRNTLVCHFMKDVFETVKANLTHLDDFDLCRVKNALLFVLREPFDRETKVTTLARYLGSELFQHQLSTSRFPTDTADIIEMFYNVFNKRDFYTSWQDETVELMLGMLEATVNSVSPGLLIPDRVLHIVFEKTFALVDQFPQYQTKGNEIVRQAVKWMSSEQIQKMSGNSELERKVQEMINSA
ncbi:Protein CBG16148 [Caenorhabditis briggsae]|uniref:Protein CBG16148 n=1 Tax=Caenorhabditis briggsae TaxID=6238 RepID=A8XP06_CAEBR|nr:Protein CBG16148 [Caenorhabditis briggsae]CAP34246.2 Protein CBG16148 [Caenorhabditis briggsae]